MASFKSEEATIGDIRKAMDADTLSSEQLLKTYLARIATHEDGAKKIDYTKILDAKALQGAKLCVV